MSSLTVIRSVFMRPVVSLQRASETIRPSLKCFRIRSKPMKTAIACTRVLTVQQGKSGLGLEAQQAVLTGFAGGAGDHMIRAGDSKMTFVAI